MDEFTILKPWGKFEEFCEDTKCTVKILTVNKNEELSLQKHKKRSEFWKVISGSGKVMLGKKLIKAKTGEEFHIKKGEIHQLIAGKKGIKVLEISFGHFDEKDIIRLNDKYHRK